MSQMLKFFRKFLSLNRYPAYLDTKPEVINSNLEEPHYYHGQRDMMSFIFPDNMAIQLHKIPAISM